MVDEAVLEVRVDASAGRGMAVRRGAGRLRHIATPTSWVQKAHGRRHRQNHENPGVSNPADLGTKHLDGGSIRRALERCHCQIRAGRAGIVLRPEVQELAISHPDVFAVDNACEVDSQSETEMESGQW